MHLIERGELETVQGLFRVTVRLFFFQSLAVKIEKLLGVTAARVSLLSELLIKKELIGRRHPISEDLTVKEVMDLKVRMCWPPRCVIWLDIIVYLVQSANTEFKVP